MAKKQGRHRKGGRTTPKGTHPEGYRPKHHDDEPGWDPEWDDAEPDLADELQAALADDHPLPLLALASSMLAVVDPRSVSPFERDAREQLPPRDDVFDSLNEIDQPETTALLAAFAAMASDDVERRRLDRMVAARNHALPPWMGAVAKAESYRALAIRHALGDGESVLVGVRLPTGHELTVMVHIDHNAGSVVTDGLVLPESLASAMDLFDEHNDDPDTTLVNVPLADAKARLRDAIDHGAITYPPYETDSWPLSRPLIEWVVGLLPAGGQGYERPEWTEEAREELIDRFFASEHGAPIDDVDHRGLLDSILWFGCDYGPGDPLRWSPTSVEILLGDWIPRKILADADYLAKAPTVVRTFIRYCHAERDIPAHLTTDTLAAVDDVEPEYQQLIRSDRPQGPAAILAKMHAFDPNGAWDLEAGERFDDGLDDVLDQGGLMRAILERAVGGSEALAELDTTPLPDEPVDVTAIAADVRDRVVEVLALIDGCCDSLLDVEHRTACRRVLARIAVNGTEVFRRRGRADTAAGAICWAVCRANDSFDQRAGGLTQKALAEHFGLTGSSGLSSRAGTLLEAGGFPRHPDQFSLGSPDYLVSRRRRQILERRAVYG